MTTTLKDAVETYLRAKTVSRGTRNEYSSTLRKWEQWGAITPIEELQRKDGTPLKLLTASDYRRNCLPI
jgi:hypothetical protein